MIIEFLTSIWIAYGATEHLNEDFFWEKKKAERTHKHCKWKFVGKTVKQDGERLFELTAPNGEKYILFKQICKNEK